MNKLKKIYTNLKLYLLFTFYKLQYKITKKTIEIKNKSFCKDNLKYLSLLSGNNKIVFRNCNFDHCKFNLINIRNIYFYKCSGIHLDFNDKEFTNLTIVRCNFEDLYLYGTNLDKIQMFKSTIENLHTQSRKMSIYLEDSTFISSYFGIEPEQIDVISCTFRNCYFSFPDLFQKAAIDCYGLEINCPEEGSFIAYKKAMIYDGKSLLNKPCIVKLLITSDASRSSATSLKCRASKVKVLEVQDLEGRVLNKTAISAYYTISNVRYKAGETIEIKNFNEDRWKECSTGIHFFMNRRNAVNY